MRSTQTMAEAMKGVAKAMRSMNKQVNLPGIQKIMMEFEQQSEIMDMKEEMMSDAIDDAMDDEADEEETEQIVNQVLEEIGINLSQAVRSRRPGRLPWGGGGRLTWAGPARARGMRGRPGGAQAPAPQGVPAQPAQAAANDLDAQVRGLGRPRRACGAMLTSALWARRAAVGGRDAVSCKHGWRTCGGSDPGPAVVSFAGRRDRNVLNIVSSTDRSPRQRSHRAAHASARALPPRGTGCVTHRAD